MVNRHWNENRLSNGEGLYQVACILHEAGGRLVATSDIAQRIYGDDPNGGPNCWREVICLTAIRLRKAYKAPITSRTGRGGGYIWDVAIPFDFDTLPCPWAFKKYRIPASGVRRRLLDVLIKAEGRLLSVKEVAEAVFGTLDSDVTRVRVELVRAAGWLREQGYDAHGMCDREGGFYLSPSKPTGTRLAA